MGDLLNFSDHIDKKQNRQRYLGYEKGKVLEETISSFIKEIPDIPEEEKISYFIKIVKKQIPVFENKYFDTKYIWNSNHLKYNGQEIQDAITIHMLKNKTDTKLLYNLSFLMHLSVYFFNNEVNNFYKIATQEYEKWGLRLFDKSIEFKNTIRDMDTGD